MFVTRAEFEDAIANGRFLEWAEFLGNLYGTPIPSSEFVDGDLLLEIDMQGAQSVRTARPDSLLIGVAPPSLDELAARMRRRGDDDAHIRRRIAIATDEMELARRICDEIVVNDDLDAAIAEISGIIMTRRTTGTASE